MPLPHDPENPQSKPLLSCFYYPHFMVKQVDIGEKGAQQLSILYREEGRGQPSCQRTNTEDEFVIDQRQWSGYFEGVRGNFVFFVGADGENGGSWFSVYSAMYGTRVFVNAAASELLSIDSILAVAQNGTNRETESGIKLRYRRMYEASCSLRLDEKKCWANIKEITGLTEVSPLNCKTSYEAGEKKYPREAKSLESDPSVITYDVEVVLDSSNRVARVTPISKARGCIPAE